jgi:cytochrome c oxidase subunit 3/cytochrome o ubiquinol oxidase subunit 3
MTEAAANAVISPEAAMPSNGVPPGHAHGVHPAKAGMMAFLLSDVALFGTLIVTYIYYLGQGPAGTLTPAETLKLPITSADTLFLLASSATIHLALKALGRDRQPAFRLWWAATLALGALFMAGTAIEWHDLIYRQGLTISSNLFGSCYYTLVGFHACHVTIGLMLLAVVLGLARRGMISAQRAMPAEVISWYWHFVDGVWVVVFTLVYIVGR